MKSFQLLIVVTLQVAFFYALASAKTESLATTAVPFHLISPAEYKAILELNNGNPFVMQNRLLNSGSQVVADIINNISNGLISPVNITGLEPIYNSVLKPQTQGYPFCAVHTNGINQHSQRSYDAVVDPASNFGTFSINFFQTGALNIDNYDEDITVDELEPSNYQKPSQAASNGPSIMIPTTSNYGPADFNKDKPDSPVAPVINCVVVLKEPLPTTTPSPTTTPTPTPTTSTQRPSNRPPVRPSFYPNHPTILTPHHPRDPHYSIGPYQIVPIPYPPFLGLIGPTSGTSNWSNWPSSQAFPSNNPTSVIPPTWPYWSVASPSIASQSNKNPQPAPTVPYLAIPTQPVSAHVPTTSSYIPSSFWATINPDAANAAPSPSISSYSNPTSWFRPPVSAFNPNHLMQQQQQHYNANTDEVRSATHDETAPEKVDSQADILIADENNAGTIQLSHKQQSRRMGVKSKMES